MKNRRVSFLRVISATILTLFLFIPAVAGDKAADLDAFVCFYHDAGLFEGSVLVAEEGKVLLQKGYGLANRDWAIPNKPDTKFRLASVSKQFTAMIIVQLSEEGKLTLDSKLSELLPYYRKDTGERVTVRNLLNHTSGVPSFTSSKEYRPYEPLGPEGRKGYALKHCMGDLEFDPGTVFRYSNSGYFLLGLIAEEVAGKPFEKLLEERIFGPLGMSSSGYDHAGEILEGRAQGYMRGPLGIRRAPYVNMEIPFSAGALYSTVEDLFRWDQALYADALCSAQGRKAIFTPGHGDYGFGWTIRKAAVGPENAERTLTRHNGGIEGFSTTICRSVEDRHLVVILSNSVPAPIDPILMGAMDILYGRTPPPPRKPLLPLLSKLMEEKGVEAALSRLGELKENEPEAWDFGENLLNSLGYDLLGRGRIDDAIAVFRANVNLNPDAPNPHDSLGEAYMAKGLKDEAVKSYARSLELNPANRNAVDMLQKLME